MIRTPKKRVYTEEKIKELTKALYEWIEVGKDMWLGSFASQQKICRNRLSELAAKDAEFGEAWELAKQAQENWLVNSAINKKIDTIMAIFALKNVAGWRDKTELEANINQRYLKDEFKDLTDEEVLQRARQVMN